MNESRDTSVVLTTSVAELNAAENYRLLPLIIYLLFISVAGICGNSLAFHIYKSNFRSSNCRLFVLVLSATDLFSCCLVIPLELLVVMKPYNFKSATACKISVLLNTWPTLYSGCLLLVIATDRFRKVCCPFQRQITIRMAKRICLAVLILTALLSCPSFTIYGIHSFTEPSNVNLTLTECSVRNEVRGSIYPLLNNVMFGIVFLGALVAICAMYCLIGIGIKQHQQRLVARTTGSSLPKNSTSGQRIMITSGPSGEQGIAILTESAESDSGDLFNSDIVTDNLSSDRTVNKMAENEGHNPIDNKANFDECRDHTQLAQSRDMPESRTKRTQSKKQIPAHRTAFIMFLVSFAFILSYLPLLCILLIRSTTPGFVESLSSGERAAYKFFLRSYYLSCAVNPVIYGVWDSKFRAACNDIASSLKHILTRCSPNKE